MTRTGAATRQTQRYEAKRDAILNAAARLFNQKGLKGATLGDVAEAVGLITTSVTYYYRRKEDLAAACLLRTIDHLNGLVETASARRRPRRGSAPFMDAYFEVLADIATGQRPEPINFYDIRALTGPQVTTVKDAFNDLFRAFRSLLRPAVRRSCSTGWRRTGGRICSSPRSCGPGPGCGATIPTTIRGSRGGWPI
jgi:AcrR family transcriptional regulator